MTTSDRFGRSRRMAECWRTSSVGRTCRYQNAAIGSTQVDRMVPDLDYLQTLGEARSLTGKGVGRRCCRHGRNHPNNRPNRCSAEVDSSVPRAYIAQQLQAKGLQFSSMIPERELLWHAFD